ncbi:RNA polymerase sigma factor SigX [Schinkia azotoformans]|uniref:RNA polymerase sigma factor n=1 Tax=Schinkia azotoformans LMG 9581 TaxID=1131731 RepID=K6DGH0_SCHAZ|nr:RNA polymerase sigma factor SigX [Schinkia azotoformans]EKN67409.1 RNA polymerase sigma factor SigX [Schinkia azotoformans LMG 9581]MEC1639339.1 RNA polymerase sigma factor SigX [Schinkia azotoformans]MEC1719698.1 RNA polymerase sigma factor SigX [Schinkia azotoformans]MEC1944407.1 RNA polymerase sigma factor SigX [Schinkia azotoformans]MED4352703.1 RNA polymerase sigma factor SigX [Schinkia azotoformans]
MKDIFQRFYDLYHYDLFQFLFYMVKNREQAEDLVQEVYIKVLQSYDRFEGRSSEKTWLFSIARHVAIDWFRKQKRTADGNAIDDDTVKFLLKDLAPLPEEVAIQNEQIQLMYQCMENCTVDQKLVLVLRYIQSFSIVETADILGWTESKVKTTQHRGLKVLKSLMEEVYNKEGMTNA